MPELPEVETIARSLGRRVRGDVIESVWIGEKLEPLKSPAADIVSVLEGAQIAGVRRVGKHLVIDLASSDRVEAGAGRRSSVDKNSAHVMQKGQWIIHLGMTGSVLVTDPAAEIEKHTHLIAKLASGRELRFVDPRRFGRLAVGRESFAAPGTEPLDIAFESFAALFRKRKTPIKSALLNQKLLSGVGNIYADEALSRGGIRPRRRAASLSRAELKKLHTSLRSVLKQAIRAGGSSISDYVDADGQRGRFQFHHRVYGREGQPCQVCKAPIKRVVIAGRSAHYCPKCQR